MAVDEELLSRTQVTLFGWISNFFVKKQKPEMTQIQYLPMN